MLLEGKNAVVDARDEAAVSEHADGIAAAAGSLDVSFNAIAVDHIQGVPLADMSEEEVVGPGRGSRGDASADRARRWGHMTRQGRGVILTFTADAARLASDHASPLTAAVVNVTCGEIAD